MNWAAIVAAINAWETTAKLAEQFVAAYISWKVKNIRDEHEGINSAREVIINKINLARAHRNSVDLINLNRSLYFVEYAGLQLNKDQEPKG
jgi:hypothetical protein